MSVNDENAYWSFFFLLNLFEKGQVDQAEREAGIQTGDGLHLVFKKTPVKHSSAKFVSHITFLITAFLSCRPWLLLPRWLLSGHSDTPLSVCSPLWPGLKYLRSDRSVLS